MIILCGVNIVAGIINCVSGFSTGNPSAGLGWLCSILGWLLVLMYNCG